MPEGGTLTLAHARGIGAHRLKSSSRCAIPASGMDEETRRRCLEPFFTTKGERGTGMGLAMVYGMVERHDAQIEIESAPGRGTTVRLQLQGRADRGRGGKPDRQPAASASRRCACW